MVEKCNKLTLSSEAKKYAEENLGETDERRKKSIAEIRRWIKGNSCLDVYIEDRTIVAFLRGCKYNIERVKQKLTNYYAMRTKIPEWYTHRDPTSPEIQEVIKLGMFVPLKSFCDNKLVLIVRTGGYDPKLHRLNDVMKVGKMIMDVAGMEYENSSIYGIVVVVDCKNIKLRYASQITPSLIKNFVNGYQSDHWRPKQIEYVQAPFYLNFILGIFKACVSSKMKNRIRGHGDLCSLHETVQKDILPKEYGGNGDDLSDLIDYWSKKLATYRQWFLNDENFEINA